MAVYTWEQGNIVFELDDEIKLDDSLSSEQYQFIKGKANHSYYKGPYLSRSKAHRSPSKDSFG